MIIKRGDKINLILLPMTKKLSTKDNINSRLILSIALTFISLLIIQNISAADVAYIYKSKSKIDKNVINAFSEMNLTVELISEKNLSQNFSRFKLIYVGNERFKNYKKIPVENFSSIISNAYYGFKLGITDRDGISRLARGSPLNVVKEGRIIQVYSQAIYDKRSISIPYYYLKSNNKNPLMEKIAGTDSGESKNIGEVISFAKAGTNLTNGKNTKSNICFFGITESDYWTTGAKQLFKDCIMSTISSCKIDSDCPADSFGDNYCLNQSVFQDIIHYTCSEPETYKSKCISNIIKNQVKNCSLFQTCNNGICLNISCNMDSDCGINGLIGNKFCLNNSVFQNFIMYTCNSPGTVNSSCSSSTIMQLNQSCLQNQICSNEQCSSIVCFNDSECNDNLTNTIDICNYPGTANASCSHNIISCQNNTDCGNDGFIGDLFCQNNGVFQNYISYTCNNPGVVNSSCSSITTAIINQNCSQNQICSNASCHNITCLYDSQCNDNNTYTFDKCNSPGASNSTCSHLNISCINNSDCGINRFIGNFFCSNLTNVIGNFLSYSCVGAGTPNSFCTNTTFPLLNQTCTNNLFCYNGVCSNITCFSDSECNDNNSNTIDICNLAGTPNSGCSYNPMICMNNSDCGTNHFSGDAFCQNENVYQNFITYNCISPGANSSCSVSSNEVNLQNCSHTCLNGSCQAGVHDVGLINLTNAINNIQLQYSNNSYIMEQLPKVNCTDYIKGKVKILNKGNYTEFNIIVNGSIENIPFNFNIIPNLTKGDSSYRSILDPPPLNLSPGFYNITVNSSIIGFNDANPLDNSATRQIQIVC